MADAYTDASAEAANIATYYFKHQSDAEVNENIVDHDSDGEESVVEMSLHYSKEEIQFLATKAEEMILTNVSCENHSKQSRASWQADTEDVSSDSDYESKISRDCFISSEPNISQRRLSPKRKLLNSRRKDWRHSLPECLEYFSPDLGHSPLPLPGRQAGGRSTQATPLAAGWEQEQCLSESQNQDNRKSVLNFGEDYAEFLTNSSESSDFSENEIFFTKYDQRKLQRQVRLKKEESFKNDRDSKYMLENSKLALEKLLKQIKRKENVLDFPLECENHLQLCEENLNILSERKTKAVCPKTHLKSIQSLLYWWGKVRNEVEEMLDQCLEFGDITNMFDCIKDDLQNLGDNAEVTINTSIDAETGLDRCKRSMSHLFQLKEDLFNVHLSVHDLLCRVSIAGHRQMISLLSNSKEEVISLYRSWDDVHKKVTEADRKYLKLSYVEAANRSISVLSNEESGNREIVELSENIRVTENLVIVNKIVKLQNLLDDLKHQIVARKTNTKVNQTKATPDVAITPNPPPRWKCLLPKLSFLSTLVILSVVSVSCWSFPQCCDYQSSWQIWPQFGYSSGPQPI